MGLTISRPEKTKATQLVAAAMRNVLAKEAHEANLNHAEALLAAAQVFTSILVGAYSSSLEKEREAVIKGLPDIVRAYIPHWEKIYADFAAHDPVLGVDVGG